MPARTIRPRPAFAAAFAALLASAPALARMPEAIPMPSAMPTILRHVSATGTTKPAGAALDLRLGTTPGLDLESRRLDHLIRTGICTRC